MEWHAGGLKMFSLLMVAASGAFALEESFNYPNGSEGEPRWFAESVSWEIQGQRLCYEAVPKTFAILEQAPHASRVRFEATVVIEARRGLTWSVAGLAIRRDGQNYWHLALAEAPEQDGRGHFVELTEMLGGNWLAQHAEETRLTSPAQEGSGFNWQYGRPYRLRIDLTPERIDGYVLERDGAPLAHIAYQFDKKAVTSGQPALDCGGFAASFDDVMVDITEEVPAPEQSRPPVLAYTAQGCDRVRGAVTGFFHTAEIDGRWWLVDPVGRGFYAVGTDHINYRGHWCEALGYAPYGRNMAAKYGSEERWAAATLERLKGWGFNTLGAGHSESLQHQGLAHTGFLSMGSSFASIDDICPITTWTGFPNVFSPKWPRHCDKIARQKCAPNRDDPWLIGYFIDNELEWYGKDYTAWGLFNEAWKKPAGHSAKQAWIAFLKRELQGPKDFQTNWGVELERWDNLANHTTPAPPLADEARTIARNWVRLLAERYFGECAEAIRRHDPNHLVLGSRFAGNAPDVWDIAGKHCDIVSFNMYPRIDVEKGVPAGVFEEITAWAESAGKPLMITEWSFPALDSGLPCQHGAGMRVDTQAQRARCFTHFQTLMFSLPFMVGSDYFMFVDEPALGISKTFPEDTNYGLVNEQDEPYPELTGAARQLHSQVYALHLAGEIQTVPPAKLASWLAAAPSPLEPPTSETLALRAGELVLEGPFEGRWRLRLGNTPLGEWYPVVHQRVAGQDLWVAPDRARIVGIAENDRVRIVEVEFRRESPGAVITSVDAQTGESKVQEVGPARFRSAWRLWVPRGESQSWFAGQYLWIENSDEVRWQLGAVYPFLVPSIGGDPAGDEPFSAGVPNYYRRGAAWVDAQVGLGVGCWYANDKDYACHYWKDPQGGFHADLRRHVDATLEPSRRHEESSPLAFFFPFRETTREGFARAVESLERDTLAPE